MVDQDPPTHPIYAWENEWVFWNLELLSRAGCRRIISQACRKYKVKPPIVKFHPNKCGFSWFMPKINTISMQRGGKNHATCLHEAAHAIAWHYYGQRIEDHGPTFLGIYMWLLEDWKVAPRSALFASARKHGLRWRELPPLRMPRRD